MVAKRRKCRQPPLSTRAPPRRIAHAARGPTTDGRVWPKLVNVAIALQVQLGMGGVSSAVPSHARARAVRINDDRDSGLCEGTLLSWKLSLVTLGHVSQWTEDQPCLVRTVSPSVVLTAARHDYLRLCPRYFSRRRCRAKAWAARGVGKCCRRARGRDPNLRCCQEATTAVGSKLRPTVQTSAGSTFVLVYHGTAGGCESRIRMRWQPNRSGACA